MYKTIVTEQWRNLDNEKEIHRRIFERNNLQDAVDIYELQKLFCRRKALREYRLEIKVVDEVRNYKTYIK